MPNKKALTQGMNLYDLRRTESGIFYFHDYIPVRLFPYHSVEETDFSQKMWKYKNGERVAVAQFTKELMYAINTISDRMISSKIGLVAVPPSKVGKYSAVRESIRIIVDWFDQGIAFEVFGCKKEIKDYGNLLTRIDDTETQSRDGVRVPYERQKETIDCSQNELSKLWTTFIILDDVTTTGTSMDACRDILIEHGAVEKYIYRLAIAKTVWE